jgi:hypothetical protein
MPTRLPQYSASQARLTTQFAGSLACWTRPRRKLKEQERQLPKYKQVSVSCYSPLQEITILMFFKEQICAATEKIRHGAIV